MLPFSPHVTARACLRQVVMSSGREQLSLYSGGEPYGIRAPLPTRVYLLVLGEELRVASNLPLKSALCPQVLCVPCVWSLTLGLSLGIFVVEDLDYRPEVKSATGVF